MKQVLRQGVKDIVVEEVPAPQLAAHHVLIKPVYSLISSGTESASIHSEGAIRTVAEHPEHLAKIWKAFKEHGPVKTANELKAKFSEFAVLGYAGAGVIVEKHVTVKNLEVGDRVAYGGEGTGHAEAILATKYFTTRIPDGLSCRSASFATLGSIALNAVRTAQIAIGDIVVVEGLGLVGQLVGQLVRLQGGIVIGTDFSEHRLKIAQQLGTHHVVKPDGSEIHAISKVTNGRGADCVIIAAASKSAEPAQQALNLTRERGRIVIVGAVDVSFPWEQMYLKEIQVLMSRAYGPGCYDSTYEKGGQDYPISHVRWTANRNMEEFLRVVSAGQVQIEPLISHEFALEDAPKAYETILNPENRSLGVVLSYPSASSENGNARNGFELARKVEVQSYRNPSTPSRPSSRELNVAVVGAGNLARWGHLPVLRKLPGVNLKAIYSKSGPRGKNYALRFGAAFCTTDYDQILSDPSIQVVVIVSRNEEHCPQALAALRAGKHVFVEKPMAITEQECALLYKEAVKSGRHLTVGFNRRFAPLYSEFKKHFARRTGPATINCRVNSPGISGAYWMADPSIGGALVGEGCHFVDLMYWLLQSEPISVSAFSLPVGKKDPVGENNIVASFMFNDGSIANMNYSTIGNSGVSGERLEAFAPGMSLMTENFKRIEVVSDVAITQTSWFPKKGYLAQMQDFVEAIRTGRPPAVTVQDGARATVGCLKILESARRSETCAIDLGSILSE